MDLDIIRRIAERGRSRAQDKSDSETVDMFQHLLDELERIRPEKQPIQSKRTEVAKFFRRLYTKFDIMLFISGIGTGMFISYILLIWITR